MKTWGTSGTDGTDVTRAELLAELLRLERRLGRPPEPADVDQHGKFSHEVYLRRFPDWDAALGEVGLASPGTSECLG